MHNSKIDELECDKEFNPQVQRIKDLHQQISEVRNMRNSFEAQIRSTAFACSKAAILRNSVLKYQKKLEVSNCIITLFICSISSKKNAVQSWKLPSKVTKWLSQ